MWQSAAKRETLGEAENMFSRPLLPPDNEMVEELRVPPHDWNIRRITAVFLCLWLNIYLTLLSVEGECQSESNLGVLLPRIVLLS